WSWSLARAWAAAGAAPKTGAATAPAATAVQVVRKRRRPTPRLRRRASSGASPRVAGSVREGSGRSVTRGLPSGSRPVPGPPGPVVVSVVCFTLGSRRSTAVRGCGAACCVPSRGVVRLCLAGAHVAWVCVLRRPVESGQAEQELFDIGGRDAVAHGIGGGADEERTVVVARGEAAVAAAKR